MKTLIREATVVTLQDNHEIIRDADVAVDGQTISYVGPQKLWEENFDRVINGQGKLLLPGFVNAHGHAAMTLFRSYADDLPLMDWLEKRIWPAEGKLKREDVYWGTMLAILEMIKCGTTTFSDMYFFMDQVAEAAEEAGIRAVLTRGLIGIGEMAEKGLEESEQFVKTWQGRGNGRITTMLGPHAPYTCPPEFLRRVMLLQESLAVPIHIHLAETKDEVERITKEYGVSPTVFLKNIGLLERTVLAAHCVHLSEEDMDILKEYNVSVAHNPGSNLKLGSGIAPVPDLLSRGITVGLGTDGAASNNNLDMMEEMRLTALIHKGNRMDPTVISAREALAMATRESAKAVFLEKVGIVAPKMKADIIMVDLQRPHLTPQHDLVAHLVYAAQPSDITMVMINGQIILENGQLTTLDEEKIIFQAQQRALHLVQ
ncbi:MAG: 5-methylthioadenosine/S-adenosylhomocysteine deaminase [Dehalococcoidia bacterium]|nr:5-methylthioadenosine/S-adenosylhomocysteine deaminase [Bacillota bacterium]MBT9142577.1 5-methylthioadenosine/S-adenosylhomocysteine deaminase [Bacillota bacterium]